MNFLLLLPILVLVAWLWLASRSIARLRRQLDETESRRARRFYTLQGRVAEIDSTVRELDFDRRRTRGEIRFEHSMKIGEAVAIHPKVREVLAAFGLGGAGCGGGGLAESSTIAESCASASLDVATVVETLNRFVRDPDAPLDVQPQVAKLYQIGKLGK